MTRRLPTWMTMSSASLVQGAGNAGAAVLATATLGAEERGVMVIAMTLSGIIGLLGGAGSGSALRALLPTADPTSSVALVASYTWISASAVVVGFVVTPMLTIASGPLVGVQLAEWGIVLASGVFAAAQVMGQQVNDAWFAAGRFRRGSLGAAASAAVALLLLSVALALGASAGTALLGQGVGALAVGVAQSIALRRAGLLKLRGASGHVLSRLLRRGSSALAMTAGLALALRADRYVVGVVAGPAAVGVYSLAATLAELPRLVPSALGQLFLRSAACGAGVARFLEVLRTAGLAALLGGVLVGVAGWVAIPFFGVEFLPARVFLLVLCLGELCFAAFFVASRGLIGIGFTRATGLVGLGGAVGAVVVYLVGGRLAGGLGVAVASGVLYGALAVATSMGFIMAVRNRSRSDLTTTTS